MVEDKLGSDGSCALIERLDPRATGYIKYNTFLDRVSRKYTPTRDVLVGCSDERNTCSAYVKSELYIS